MAKSPSYQWYPGDFRRELTLRACSFYARAVWREMLDAMHEGEPYGHLAISGRAISPDEFARMIGEPVAKVRKAIEELGAREVYSVSDSGLIFSRRMVRDERTRRLRAAGGSKGGNPALKVRGEDNGKVNLEANLEPTLPPTPSSSVFSLQTDGPGTPMHPGPDGSVSPLRYETGAAAPPVGRKSVAAQEQPSHATVMPILRERGFHCDRHDGSIVKALIKSGVSTNEFSTMAEGLALLRDRGELTRFDPPIQPGDKLSMRLVYANGASGPGRLPLWRKAEQAALERRKRSRPDGKGVSGILGISE